jgi:hypothetical protein
MISYQQPLMKRCRNVPGFFYPDPGGTLSGPAGGNISEVDSIYGWPAVLSNVRATSSQGLQEKMT